MIQTPCCWWRSKYSGLFPHSLFNTELCCLLFTPTSEGQIVHFHNGVTMALRTAVPEFHNDSCIFPTLWRFSYCHLTNVEWGQVKKFLWILGTQYERSRTALVSWKHLSPAAAVGAQHVNRASISHLRCRKWGTRNQSSPAALINRRPILSEWQSAVISFIL